MKKTVRFAITLKLLKYGSHTLLKRSLHPTLLQTKGWMPKWVKLCAFKRNKDINISMEFRCVTTITKLITVSVCSSENVLLHSEQIYSTRRVDFLVA